MSLWSVQVCNVRSWLEAEGQTQGPGLAIILSIVPDHDVFAFGEHLGVV